MVDACPVDVISALLRDLNHHLPLFSTMARITLADWTCSVAHCQSPLASTSPAFARSYTRLQHKLPRAWVVVHSVLRELHISIVDTDVSHLFTGQVALQHLARSSPASARPPLPPHLLPGLASAGFTPRRIKPSCADCPNSPADSQYTP